MEVRHDDDLVALIGAEAASEVAAGFASEDEPSAKCEALDAQPEDEGQDEGESVPALTAGEAMPHLPTMLATIAEVVGEEAALNIAEAHGGTEVHIPLTPDPDHWLSELIGQPEAAVVAAALAMQVGLRVKIPFRPTDTPDTASLSNAGGMGSCVLDEIAEVIGSDATLALAAEFMGERTYIPKNYTIQPRIAAAIGVAKAKELCNVFYRICIQFPPSVVIHRLVMDFAERGMTKREIAKRLSIREKRVYDILRLHRAATSPKRE
ncbi:hypothetical protein [uncultured Novosphingobium sp.]|uniref:hypothetical protein n=1 Tax=uncultured Novosphingobium sp. TaxID=292277 RepID=UPI00259A1ACD|nr:hypothetical protein [uncultured Novosphingobium sp.]